jgi:hypothetical protein
VKLPVIDQTAWINRGNRPEKVTARAVRIPQSRAATVGGKGVHMEAPGIKAVMTAPRQFRATDLHRENAHTVKPAVPVPRKRAAAEGSVRVWRAAGAVPTVKKIEKKPRGWRPDPKPRTCEVCGVTFPSRKAWGKHYRDTHFVARESS